LLRADSPTRPHGPLISPPECVINTYDTVLTGVASMRNTKVVSISMPAEMLKAAEIMAKQENRTILDLAPNWIVTELDLGVIL
jgi:hypothetical protein